MITINVVANGEMFREGFNALVTFLGEDTFSSFFHIGLGLGFFAILYVVVTKQDWLSIIRWYGMVVFLTAIALTPRSDVAIIDSSNPGSALTVDNVPSLLAGIVGIFTQTSYGVTAAMETAFHLPDDLNYNKTGMLFGSKMFEASKDFQILSPTLHAQMDDYMQNCVIGDMLINKKYNLDALKSSTDLLSQISSNPSPVRRVTIDGEFVTCKDATSILKQALLDEINKQSMVLYGRKLFGPNASSYQALFEQYLPASYDYLLNASGSATNIFMQTMLINAMNDGVRDYAAYSQSSAGLQNYVTTKATLQNRSAWLAFGEEAIYVLPLMQTMLLLIICCVFPFVVVLSLFPQGFQHWVDFLRFIVWIELWPPLFSILNMATNYVLEPKSAALADGGVSMMNINALFALHQDTAAIAGYFSLAIPAIAGGLVSRSLFGAFRGLVGGMTGQVQSHATSASNEATSGNFSMGNTNYRNASYNNTNANKHDTNWTDFQGSVSTQTPNGVVKTTTEDGTVIWDTSHGMSNLPINLNLSEQLSSTLSQSAEKAHSAAVSESHSMQTSLSSAASSLVQLGGSSSRDVSVSEGVSKGLSDSETHALNTLKSHAREISESTGVSLQEAYAEMGQIAYSGKVGMNSEGGLGKVLSAAVGIKGSASVSGTRQDSSTHQDHYTESNSLGLSQRDVSDVSEAFNVLASHQQHASADTRDTQSDSLVNNVAADLRSATTASHNMNADLTESQRLSEMATLAQTNSSAINTNLNQAFVGFVERTEGKAHADSLFSTSTSSLNSQAQLQTLANRFVNHEVKSVASGEFEGFKAGVNPSALYESGSQRVNNAGGSDAGIVQDYQKAQQSVSDHQHNFGNTATVAEDLRQEVNQHLHSADKHVKSAQSDESKNYTTAAETETHKLAEGRTEAMRTIRPFDKETEVLKKMSHINDGLKEKAIEALFNRDDKKE